MTKEKSDTKFILLASDSFPEIAGHQVLDGGVLKQRFRKDLIRVGHYVNTRAGFELDVTVERIDAWIAAFKRMQTAGIQIPVPAGHSYDPRDNQGYLISLEREGETLWGITEMIGDEAIALAYRTQQVSISVNPEFTDGKGTAYGEVIEHVALTTYPVVPGQEDFKAIAASLVPPNEKGDTVMTEDQMKKLRELLGVGDDLTEETFLDQLAKRFETHATEKKDSDAKITALSGEVETLKAKSTDDKDVKITLTPEIEDVLVEGVEAKAASLVATGKITPAVKDKLLASLVGEKGKRNVFALSRTATKTDKSLANSVLDALAENDIVKLGEQTGHQVRTLDRITPDGGNAEADAKTTTEMIDSAGGPPEKK